MSHSISSDRRSRSQEKQFRSRHPSWALVGAGTSAVRQEVGSQCQIVWHGKWLGRRNAACPNVPEDLKQNSKDTSSFLGLQLTGFGSSPSSIPLQWLHTWRCPWGRHFPDHREPEESCSTGHRRRGALERIIGCLTSQGWRFQGINTSDNLNDSG